MTLAKLAQINSKFRGTSPSFPRVYTKLNTNGVTVDWLKLQPIIHLHNCAKDHEFSIAGYYSPRMDG